MSVRREKGGKGGKKRATELSEEEEEQEQQAGPGHLDRARFWFASVQP
jgi:hypothetical protein